ncbi:phosphatase PAP2 family protein [Inquilinus sp. OTU3971]|uniref:phosphatase PAP2 family protein n=1 Tax=Inquilinus sp. OTU3971 TaxID=3043855 RepID=UPI00313D85A8
MSKIQMSRLRELRTDDNGAEAACPAIIFTLRIGGNALGGVADKAPGTLQRAVDAAVNVFEVFGRSLRARMGLLILVALHLLSAICVAGWIGRPYHSGMVANGALIALTLMPAFLCVASAWRCLDIVIRIRPNRPLLWLWNDVRQVLCNVERLAGGAVVLLILLVFMGSFAFLKESIPAINPFSWDKYFEYLDRVLHGGHQPFELLWPLLGGSVVTAAINFLYNIWFFILFFIVITVAFSASRPTLQRTFLYAFVLTWSLGGNLLATIFSSAGPAYFARLGLGDGFEPLMASLRSFADVVPVWALGTQDTLWQAYTGSDAAIAGISAMPSMHVASSVLFVLYGFGVSRRIGWPLVAFAVAIFLGSIHLGWHYAVDGYMGVVVALAAWWMAVRLQRRRVWYSIDDALRRFERRPAAAGHDWGRDRFIGVPHGRAQSFLAAPPPGAGRKDPLLSE